MLPSINLIERLKLNLQQYTLKIQQNLKQNYKKRASIGIILKDNYDILFIQRAYNKNDRWSNQLAFPGGRNQANETDYETCIREIKEEIGLNMNDIKKYDYLGQFQSMNIPGYGNTKGLTVNIFVFYYHYHHDHLIHFNDLKLDHKEVSNVLWVPLNFFKF